MLHTNHSGSFLKPWMWVENYYSSPLNQIFHIDQYLSLSMSNFMKMEQLDEVQSWAISWKENSLSLLKRTASHQWMINKLLTLLFNPWHIACWSILIKVSAKRPGNGALKSCTKLSTCMKRESTLAYKENCLLWMND